jgi:AcrR family transcriptional regulator
VDEIVARAEVSKGTFFNYFARKDDLLHSVIERRYALAETSAAEILSLAIPVRDQLLALFAEAAHAWEEDREWSRHVLAGFGGATFRKSGDPARWRDLIRVCVERGQRSGEFRIGADSDRAAALLTAVYHDTLSRWGARAEFGLQHELREQLLLVLDGLGE